MSSDKSYKFVSCEFCLSKSKGLFNSFGIDEVADLNHHKNCKFYKKNQPLFADGSSPRGVFCINKGKVKVYALGEGGKEQIIQIAKPGDVLGFRAMFGEEAYKVSASTIEDCNICFIGKDEFLTLVDENKELKNRIMKELSKELIEQSEFITNMAQKSIRERSAYVLAILADVYEGELINLTREDLANYIGTATETLIRLLREFIDEEIIATHKRKIEILDLDKLKSIGGVHN